MNKKNIKLSKKVIRKIIFFISLNFLSLKNKILSSYSSNKKIRIEKIIRDIHISSFHDKFLINNEIVNFYINHTFDLLGSGWVKIYHGMDCAGIESYQYRILNNYSNLISLINRKNLNESKYIFSKIIGNYEPIDWQIDFKSGYRWRENILSKKIKFNNIIGADIKVPWELSRMQHLPQLALYCVKENVAEKEKNRIINEFKNQVIDFIAMNPPGYGVNWVCPMEIGIRVSNWLLAWDILSCKHNFDNYFIEIFSKSVYEHGKYIFSNLENYPIPGNHYLANIVGLAFISSYLQGLDEVDEWLVFSFKELLFEVNRQFYPDGGNFENSTTYHRLSTEMAYFGTAIIMSISEDRIKNISYFLKKYNISKFEFPGWYLDKLKNMAYFIHNISKKDGTIPQIGDNDSGKFFKLSPRYIKFDRTEAKSKIFNLKNKLIESDYYFEDLLNSENIMDLYFGLIGDRENDFCSFSVDNLIIRKIKNKFLKTDSYFLTSDANRKNKIGKILELDKIEDFSNLFNIKKEIYLCRKIDFNFNMYMYEDFGIYIIKSDNLYLSIRCITSENHTMSGHAHYDQLSLELQIDGQNLILDPGTYLYTPIPSQRRIYRSTISHYSPFIGNAKKEMINDGIFELISIEKAEVKYFGRDGFWGETKNGKLIISIKEKQVEIVRLLKKDIGNVAEWKKLEYSPAYGVRVGGIF